MSKNPVYAVLIGVSNYTTYDPSGRSNLKGAQHDVVRWRRFCVDRLHLDAETQIHSLTEKDDTTRDAILAAVKWLGQQLAANPESSALLTFSGHGLTIEDPDGSEQAAEGLSLAIAPSDIGHGLEEAITLAHLETALFESIALAKFDTAHPTDDDQIASVCKVLLNVTFVIDACYDRPDDEEAVRGLLKASGPPSDTHMGIPRLIIGSHLWQSCYEIKVAGEWHGAFSFAMCTMLEQWDVTTDSRTPVTYSRASNGDLVFRARQLLDVLGVPDQTPTLLGSQNNLALVPFLRPGKRIDPAWTTSLPDAPRRREELSGGTTNGFRAIKVKWRASSTASWQNLGIAIVPKNKKSGYSFESNSYNFKPPYTYWFFNKNFDQSAGTTGEWKLTTKHHNWQNSGIAALDQALGYAQHWPKKDQPDLWNSYATPPDLGSSQCNSGTLKGAADTVNFGIYVAWTPLGSTQVKSVDRVIFFAETTPNPVSAGLDVFAASENIDLTPFTPASDWVWALDTKDAHQTSRNPMLE